MKMLLSLMVKFSVEPRTTPQVKFKIAILDRISVLLEKMTLETGTSLKQNGLLELNLNTTKG